MKDNPIEKVYVDVSSIKCPVCNGHVNSKWFNFKGQKNVEFIAECWTPENPDLPRHLFYFQVEVPECVLFDEKGQQSYPNVKDDKK